MNFFFHLFPGFEWDDKTKWNHNVLESNNILRKYFNTISKKKKTQERDAGISEN